ncbi:MAG: 30S ribosomal protein S12 methylthiotransferase RimO, partial [Clostridia bacterium]|nr:30S ribosomal protein S12 methylthiotransferase RimO [Clostridia bacterium]
MKIGAISLGCDKNRVDTEKMLARLVNAGHTLVGSEEDADVIIVNTCAFIDKAKEESIDEILGALNVKADSNGAKKVIITGCLAKRYADELKAEFEEADAILGIADYDKIVETIEKVADDGKVFSCFSADKFYADRVLTTP